MMANNEIGVSDQMWPVTSEKAHAESVTVTLTQKPGDGKIKTFCAFWTSSCRMAPEQ